MVVMRLRMWRMGVTEGWREERRYGMDGGNVDVVVDYSEWMGS